MKRIIPILSTLLVLLICSACTNADEPIKIKDPETVVPPLTIQKRTAMKVIIPY